jgi:hypothetical protein
MKIKMVFVYDAQLNEDGVGAYMDEDTTFGVAVWRVCRALGMRLDEWSFFFGPYEGVRDRAAARAREVPHAARLRDGRGGRGRDPVRAAACAELECELPVY